MRGKQSKSVEAGDSLKSKIVVGGNKQSKLVETEDLLKLNIAVVGEPNVGKHTMIKHCSDMTSPPKTPIDFVFKNMHFIDMFYQKDEKVKTELKTRTQFWKLSKSVMDLTEISIEKADGVIFVYDLTNIESFEKIQEYWIPLARNLVAKGTKFMLIGNQFYRQRAVERSVSLGLFQAGIKLADKFKMPFHEVNTQSIGKIPEMLTEFSKEVAKGMVEHIPLKDVYMNFLLWINDDFDDDLLMDALEVLVNI